MRAMLSVLLLLLVTVQATTGQAPGDEDDICLQDVLNKEVLMSSFNYRNLLPSRGGPWTVVNNDNNNDNFTSTSVTTWTQAATTCSRTVGVCGFTFGSQDNWLITQFINNTMRQAVIYIRVRYAINSQCAGARGCLTTLDVYVLQTNTLDMSFGSNISSVFVTRSIAALTDTVRDGITIVTRIIPVMANLSTAGLYVAFRDLGTCIVLAEVTMFYPVCDAILLNFGANFSEMERFPDDISSGVCFANMAISINPLENSFTATCTLMLNPSQQTDQLFTNWTINGTALPQCMCLPGYEFTNRTTSLQCQACEPFYFKNTLNNSEMCRPCPLFSNTSELAMEVCPCDDGYFRLSDGSEDAMRCTRPPSAPQNLAVSDVTNTSAIIMWEAPEDNGDRTDLFYSVSHNVTSDVFNTTSTIMMLTGLIPFVYYELRVTADNGVSSQDNDVNARTVTISIMTEGAPSMTAPSITGIMPLSGTSFTVNWTANDLNNSFIITWINLNTNMTYNVTVPENTSSYTVTGLNGIDNYNVSVTANNSDGMMMSNLYTVYDEPNPPMNVRISEITGGSFVVQWDAVTDFFNVSYNVTRRGEDRSFEYTIVENALSLTVTGLKNNTSYNVTVAASNTCCGTGPYSDVVVVMTNTGGDSGSLPTSLSNGVIIATAIFLVTLIAA